MMRVTNSMMVKRTKSNLNYNRSQVDRVNNQMSTQKKITKPSDNPIIAIRSLRLRSSLSTITQFYENNIPDTESWMDVTETALTNMKDLITKAYEQVVYGASDQLSEENRRTILKELQALQEQIYSEGNSDYAGRTVFTGYKTNQQLTFMDTKEAQNAEYDIQERFSYKDIKKKKYYSGSFDDTSDDALLDPNKSPDPFSEVELNRVRLSYAEIDEDGNSLNFSYNSGGEEVSLKMNGDGSVTINGLKFSFANGVLGAPVYDGGEPGYTVSSDGNGTYTILDDAGNAVSTIFVPAGTTDADGNMIYEITSGGQTLARLKGMTADDTLQTTLGDNNQFFSYTVSTTPDLENSGYNIGDNEIVFDRVSGELIFKDSIAEALDAQKLSFTFDYHKTGFEKGELRPENYFDCVKHASTGDITYTNFDEDGNWITEGIYYNIAGGQEMKINTEARDAFNSDIRRDMDDLMTVVQRVLDAQATVNTIKEKIESGIYEGDDLKQLNDWLDAANKQLDYYTQNMHDTYKSYITNFQKYLDDVDLTITDVGGRMSRVSLTKNRMSIQQSTFKELKSNNEDEDLSDLVINYTAASVAYQAALQAAAKIGNMTLLDYL